MNDTLLLLVFWYFFVPFSLIGYGLVFQRIAIKNHSNLNFGYAGLIGIFLLIIYSYLSHIFISHFKLHNLLIIIGGFVGYLFFLYTNKNNILKETIVTLIVLLILFASFLIYKNHDDFSYYHFPYTYYLTQHVLTLGLGNFGHGFRTQSSIFYLNSLFYLPLIDYHLFNMGAVLILCYSNIILLNNIFKNLTKQKVEINDNFIRILSLLAFAFINIFFYRIGEHGTDRSAQILILLFFIEIVYFLNLKIPKKNDLIYIYLFLGLIVSLKAFYFLYFIALISLIFYVKDHKIFFRETLNFLIFNKFFFLFSFLIIFVLLTNFFNSGCFVYPVYFTCLESMSWSIPTLEVKQMNNWYELWSKAGANPNSRVDNPLNYINNFNWVSNWIDIYFFNKVSEFLYGILILSLFVYAFFIKSKKKNNYKSINLKSIYIIIILLLIEWFYNHPSLRYGGYSLIVLLFFIPISSYLSRKVIYSDMFLRNSTIIVIIATTIFFGRNINRIHDEHEKYSYNPLNYSFYDTTINDFRIEEKMKKIQNKNMLCKQKDDLSSCLGETIKTRTKFGKIIYENKK